MVSRRACVSGTVLGTQTQVGLWAEAFHTSWHRKVFMANLDPDCWEISVPIGKGRFPIDDTGPLVFVKPRVQKNVDEVVDRWVSATAGLPEEAWDPTTTKVPSRTGRRQCNAVWEASQSMVSEAS
jgi:hypothetical protein